MLISDVIKETGLTRKAIYFYEEKSLVFPERDSESGVRNYSENDVERLISILRLRELDMSLSAISEIIDDPEKIELVLQKHIKHLQDKLNEVVTSIGKLNTIMNNFPPNGDMTNFQEAADIVMARSVEDEMNYKFKKDIPIGYGRKITMQLFEAFLDLPVNTSKRWDSWYKLLDKVEECCTDDLIVACDEMFSDWDIECSYEDFQLRKELVYGYTKYSDEDYIEKSKEIIFSLQSLVEDETSRAKWLDYYWNFLCPVMKISNKEINHHIKDLSSVYEKYHGNFRHLVSEYLRPYMESSEGLSLRGKLKEVLGDAYSEDINIIQFFDFYNNTFNSNHLV